MAQRFRANSSSDSAPLDEYIGAILDDMAQSGELSANQDWAAVDLKQDLNDRIVRNIVAALPAEAATELSRRLNEPGADVSSIHQFLLDSGVDIAAITSRVMLDYPVERPSGPFSPSEEGER